MILQQIYLGCLSQASYLIGDSASGVAAVVDPRRDVDVYLEEAARHGLTIQHVLLTHFHADFVSGHLELARRSGATIRLGAAGRADYACEPLREGDVLELGPQVRIEVLETPGHTPESLSYLVWDLAADATRPHAVLTGDALFIGDVGRPDLLVSAGMTSEELAGMLYESLRNKLMPLPDETLVYPAHGAGSSCGKNLSRETFATLGSQRQANWALQPMSKEEFVRELCANQPHAPGYFAWSADYNRRERPMLDDVVARSMVALPLDQVLERRAGGALVLDVREPNEYAAGHLAGSINVGLSGRYAGWAGTVVPQGVDLIVVAEPGSEHEALTRLARIGYDTAVGYLDGGARALEARPDLMARHRRMDCAELAAELASTAPPLVLDVRAPGEWGAGHIEGALLLPLDVLEAQLETVPRERPVVVACQGGYRSSIAASLMERHGLRVAGDLIGGFSAWSAAGLPVAVPPAR
jgi:glyoxylase-like metal-dependent hydrolase (beta-lactamase superfamily II)/rhodanese-related sulfurtransferase